MLARRSLALWTDYQLPGGLRTCMAYLITIAHNNAPGFQRICFMARLLVKSITHPWGLKAQIPGLVIWHHRLEQIQRHRQLLGECVVGGVYRYLLKVDLKERIKR